MGRRLGNWIGAYRGFALLFTNLLLVFAVLNGVTYVVLKSQGKYFPTYSQELDRAKARWYEKHWPVVYPGMEKSEIVKMWGEMLYPQGYAPHTEVRQRPQSGAYVNVSQAGFRHSADQGPWPISEKFFNVFVFGGSTTFGFGLPDWQTVPSFLQEKLGTLEGRPVKVYNFGQMLFGSTQERIVFNNLMMLGIKPDLAIFLDGLNDSMYYDSRITHTATLARYFEHVITTRRRGIYGWKEAWAHLPVVQGAPHAKALLMEWVTGTPAAGNPYGLSGHAILEDATYDDANVNEAVITRYQGNMAVIEGVGERFGVPVFFVWQPVPMHRYELDYHVFLDDIVHPMPYAKYAYRAVEARMAQEFPQREFIWCADIQEGVREPLYLDPVHYTSRMAERFAETIVARARQRGLI